MFVKQLFLSTLAVASLVSAQSSKLCSADKNTINTQADLDKIAECETLKGHLIIGEDMTTFSCPNLQTIEGDFIADGAAVLGSIQMPVLKQIEGSFTLNRLTTLLTLNCPKLTRVGSISWTTLPALTVFSAGITEASTVQISDTQLNAIDGINLKTVQRFTLDNNRYLKKVEMTGLKNVVEIFSSEFNAPTMEINLPSLVWSKNMTIIGARVITLPSLQHVNGSMNIGNNSIQSIECKNLTEIDQTLAFIGNPQLTKIDMSKLKVIGGGFKIHNNTLLANISDFDSLETVRGACDFVGNMKYITLPSLQDVQGGFNLQTTQVFDQCAKEFDGYRDNKVIKGNTYTCKGEEENPTTADGTPGSGSGNTTGSGSGSGQNPGGDAGRLGISSALLGVTIAVIAFSV